MSRFIRCSLAIAAAFAPLSPATSAECDPSNTADFSIGDFDDGVTDLAVLGDSLFAAGPFTSAGPNRAGGIARWDADHWTPLGPTQSRNICAMINHSNQLIAAGVFDNDTMIPARGIARWNAERWELIPNSPAIEQSRLLSAGSTLYAVGLYETGQGLGPVASWDGTTWTRYPVLKNAVVDAAVHQGSLYVCGFFGPGSDETAPSKIAKWDGTQWASVNWDGVEVLSLATHNGVLYAGTESASGNLLWQYDGTQWTAIPSTASAGAINRLISTAGGLVAVGTFTSINDQPLAGIALWNGTTWQPYGNGIVSDAKCAIEWHGDLVVGGWLQMAGDKRTNNIAAWNKSRWTPFSAPGNGINGRTLTSAVHNSKLIASAWCAGFGDAGGRGAASWNGIQWNALNLDQSALVKKLESVNGTLYGGGYIDDAATFLSYPLVQRSSETWTTSSKELAGGAFDVAGDDEGVIVVGSMFNLTSGLGIQIARYDGNIWTSLAESGDGYVEHVISWGGRVVVSGSFESIDGVAAHNIAMRTSAGWQPLAGGLDGQITALSVHGSHLYAAVAGDFFTAGVRNAVVYRFENDEWTPLTGNLGDQVLAMASYDGDLYIGGTKHTTQGTYAPTLFKLEGDTFVPLDRQPDGTVTSLSVFDQGIAPSLFIFGDFSFFGDRPSVRIAEYTTCPCQADVNHDHLVNAMDLSVMLSSFGRRTDNAYDVGDVTGDRRVTSGDLSVLLQRFGSSCE